MLCAALLAAMRIQLEVATLNNPIQRLMNCNKLGDWTGSDGLFERAEAFSSIPMRLRVRLLVMRARRLLFRGDYGAAITLCKEGKRMENLLGTGNKRGYMDNIIRSCIAGQRARL